ncbi:unnamed protein product [Owenia fusiformis]|uniref:Asl1-like glycosyl hydrolase catalytic domain-containing protein n=1 Tax=Owenia fusiformis TaxID=6347 RepID=A0A8S4Q6F5_OWEFU|nr:unnamed protein product [Owenia fusiformis]
MLHKVTDKSASPKSQKKGVCISPKNYKCGDTLAFNNVHWWYDWNLYGNYHKNKHCSNKQGQGRIPMIWTWSHRKNKLRFLSNSDKIILGFNEPNFVEQANLLPEEAADLWMEIQEKLPDVQLVSPSASTCVGSIDKCNSGAVKWFDRFFKACKNCEIKYLATHAYWCDPNMTMKYLEALWRRYKKQIWLTEFACPFKNTTEGQLEFMKAILPLFERAEYVYRYAWYSSRVPPHGWIPREASLLRYNDSTLTPLGIFYNKF